MHTLEDFGVGLRLRLRGDSDLDLRRRIRSLSLLLLLSLLRGLLSLGSLMASFLGDLSFFALTGDAVSLVLRPGFCLDFGDLDLDFEAEFSDSEPEPEELSDEYDERE